MQLFFRYDWLIYIVFGTVVLIEIRRKLELRPAVAAMPLFIANLPWLLVGIGKFLYFGRDTFDLFDLRIGVLAYALVVSAVTIWVAIVWWLFRGGAERIASFPAAARTLRVPENASSIKLFTIAAIAGGVMGLTMMVYVATEQPR